MAKIEPRQVWVNADECATVEDVLQLILRLPYQEACALAECIHADVDRMTDGAVLRLTPPPAPTRTPEEGNVDG